MKYSLGFTLAVAVAMATGCASHKSSLALAPIPTQPAPAIVTPDNSLAATVLMYNPEGRFVVLNFPSGNLPKRDQVMFIYHGGLKAGEAKITGPQRDNNVVADLTRGTAQPGDEVRDQ